MGFRSALMVKSSPTRKYRHVVLRKATADPSLVQDDSALGKSLFGASRSGRFDADDFNFETAEFRMVVFANTVGNVDNGTLFETEFSGAGGEVPSDGADGCAGTGIE